MRFPKKMNSLDEYSTNENSMLQEYLSLSLSLPLPSEVEPTNLNPPFSEAREVTTTNTSNKLNTDVLENQVFISPYETRVANHMQQFYRCVCENFCIPLYTKVLQRNCRTLMGDHNSILSYI
jgi:hypothetical protein